MRSLLVAAFVAVIGTAAVAQPPELIWYDFNAADGTNLAAPGVGNGTADPSLTFPNALCGGDLGCQSPAQAATTQVDTNWVTNLTGDWTIGMHLDLTAGGGFANYFQYCFGDSTAGGFRSFVDGAAGNGNIILRGPLTQAIITGGGDQTAPVHVAWVYDSSVPEIRGYLNGVLNVTVPQSALSIVGTSNFTVMRYNGSTSSMRPGCIMDDFRLYSRAIDLTGTGPGSELDNWVTGCFSGPPPAPVYQVDQPGAASNDIDGVVGSAYAEAITTKCAGEAGVATIDGGAGSMFDTLIGIGATVTPGTGAIVLPDGQIINANLLASSTLSGLPVGSLVPFPGTITVPFATPAPFQAYIQSYFTNPSSPIGFSLSQPASLNGVLSSGPQSLTLADDNSVEVTLGGQPLCGPSTVNFFGVTYSSIFVNSNGSVGFGAGDGDFSATVAEFQSGAPRLAGMWSDLSPNAGGTVTVSATANDYSVTFTGVPEYPSNGANSVTMIVDVSGLTTITGYLPDPTHTTDTLIGITPGGAAGATDPGGVSFLGFLGMGNQGMPLSTDMVYEYTVGGAVPGGWNNIVFPNGDSSIYFVN